MTPQIKPNRSACLVTAFAMATGMPVEKLIEEIGHDGMAIQWPDYAPPFCYRAIHAQEIIDVILRHGFSATEIHAQPMAYSKKQEDAIEVFTGVNLERVLAYINAHVCVLILDHPPHAVAANIAGVIDPDTGERSPLDFWLHRLESFYIIQRVKT